MKSAMAPEELYPIPETTRQTLRRLLLRWYAEEHRPLPWRLAPSEYATVVSEFMLQQTQMTTVLPYFESFMARFPSFEALAAAPEQDVLHAWSGLGYYRRARMLKRAAEKIVSDFGGSLPRDPKDLATLPGFGEYTVGAVGSIALGLPLPLVDGNVRRVLGRVFALEGDLSQGEGKKTLWSICEQLVDPGNPGDFNQGLMELGATVCVPREPLCLVCPLFEQCKARAIGYPEAYPAPMRRPAMKAVREVAVALMRQGKVLALQRGEGSSFAGMWELPRLDTREVMEAEDLTPGRVLFDMTRVRAGEGRMLGKADSTFTNHNIRTELYLIEDDGEQPVRRQRHVAHRWVSPKTLAKLPASRAQHRLFALLQRAMDEQDPA